jgi:hypothetical protein
VFVFARRMSNFISKVKSAVSFCPSRSHASSRVGSDIEVDPPAPAVGSSSHQASMENLILLKDKQIKLQDD